MGASGRQAGWPSSGQRNAKAQENDARIQIRRNMSEKRTKPRRGAKLFVEFLLADDIGDALLSLGWSPGWSLTLCQSRVGHSKIGSNRGLVVGEIGGNSNNMIDEPECRFAATSAALLGCTGSRNRTSPFRGVGQELRSTDNKALGLWQTQALARK